MSGETDPIACMLCGDPYRPASLIEGLCPACRGINDEINAARSEKAARDALSGLEPREYLVGDCLRALQRGLRHSLAHSARGNMAAAYACAEEALDILRSLRHLVAVRIEARGAALASAERPEQGDVVPFEPTPEAVDEETQHLYSAWETALPDVLSTWPDRLHDTPPELQEAWRSVARTALLRRATP